MATMDQLVTAFQNARKAGDEAAAQRLAKAIKALQQQGVDRSFSSAFQQGIDDPLENMATTARMLGAEGTADTLSGLTSAPTNYESAANRFMNPQEGDFTVFGFAPAYLPRASVEQAGQLAGSIATRAGGATLGSAFGPKGTVVGALAGPALFEFVQQLGPIAAERARNNGRSEPEWEDWTGAAAAAGVSGALNAIGVRDGAGASMLNKTMREGVTEGTQSVVEQTGSTAGTDAGLSISPRQAIGEGIIGGTTAGGFDATGKVVNKATRVFTGTGDVTDPEAAADLAQRLNGIVEANNIDLSDVKKTSTKGARQAVDLAHSQLGADMRQLIDDLKVRLKVDRLDPAETVADKVLAEAGTAEARTKTKSIVGQQEFDATERLVGDTAEGQQLLKLFRETNELTELHNNGYIGGFSQFTDQLSPFASNVGYTARSAAELPTRLLATGAGATLNPAIPAAQAAAVGAGRTIDALTGRRSRVRRFINQNQGNQGVQTPDVPSLRAEAIAQDELEQRQAATEERRQQALRLDMLQAGDPPKGDPTDPNPSPEYRMFEATGLGNRRDVSDVLSALRKSRPLLRPAINSYNKMLRDGTQVKDLNKLISAAKGYADKNPQMFPNRQTATPAAGTAVAANETPGYLRGIEANRQAIANAKASVDSDSNMALADKELTKQALDQMGGNLGLQPVDTANEIMDRTVDAARNKDKVKSYLQPYVDRVERQQKNRSPEVNPTVELSARIAPGEEPGPALGIPDVFSIGSDIETTNLPIYPREGYKPAGDVNMSLNQAVQYLHDRWEKSTGRKEPFEYTPENIERIAKMMAAEAERALQDDTNAIGWYDRKLKAAKSVLSLVEPRIFETADNEAAFDLALAVTSNGAAVTDNFANAVEVFRSYLDTGQMPADTWKKGGERNQAMREAFQFHNAYEKARAKGRYNMAFQDFMDADFQVRDLVDYINRFNEANDTNISLSVSENMDTTVKGSFVLGAKIGQGFYQNIRGNYDPLTMDIWWMRMWNRLVGRPFAESKDSDMIKNRKKVANIVTAAFKPKSGKDVERKLVKEALDRLGENRVGLYGNPERMDAFITALDSRWQSYFKKYQKDNGKNPPKPQLFKTTGTHTKNLKGKLQATPAGGGERQVMRDATRRAIELLAGVGYNIDTADFQALMWYPEKRLFRSLGVKPGRGEDNDYLDAATILAKNEGISDDQIQEALPDSERVGFDPQPSAGGQDGSLRGRPGGTDGEASVETSRQFSFDFGDTEPGRSQSDTGRQNLSPRLAGSRPATTEQIRDVQPVTNAMFEIGKPGGEFEDGIRDIPTAIRLAEALGAAMYIVNNKAALGRVFGFKGSMDKPGEFNMGGAMMMGDPRNPTRDPQTGEMKRAVVGLMGPYQNPRNLSETVTAREAVFNALHEVAHIIEGSFVPGETKTKASPRYTRLSDKKQVTSKRLYDYTFRQGIASLMDAAAGLNIKGYTKQDAQEILDEIVQFQRTGVLDDGRTPIRSTYREFNNAIDAAQQAGKTQRAAQLELQLMDAEDSYFQIPQELAADLIGFYLYFPGRAKRLMPKATKLVRDILNSSKVVTFYSMPLATLVAAIFANMLVAEGEEEDQQAALALGRGALTA